MFASLQRRGGLFGARDSGHQELCDGPQETSQGLRGHSQFWPDVDDASDGASGSSVDWFHEALGVKYAYALEVRDLGRRGFLLPQEEIVPTGNEIFVALSKMVNEIANREINNLDASSPNV